MLQFRFVVQRLRTPKLIYQTRPNPASLDLSTEDRLCRGWGVRSAACMSRYMYIECEWWTPRPEGCWVYLYFDKVIPWLYQIIDTITSVLDRGQEVTSNGESTMHIAVPSTCTHEAGRKKEEGETVRFTTDAMECAYMSQNSALQPASGLTSRTRATTAPNAIA